MQWEYLMETDRGTIEDMNARGRERWELVAVRQTHSHRATLYWKRPLASTTAPFVKKEGQICL